MALTLAQKPGWSDFPNAQLAAEDFARGSAFSAALDNTKFGAVRLEFFYGNYVDGDTVLLPVSTADGYKYKVSELIYLWTWRLTANPKDGKTGGPGTILWMDSRVEQSNDTDPGLVHSKVVYHVQGSETTETEDGTLGVTTIAIRGRDELTAAAAPTWTDQADTEYNLDSVLKTERATRLNDNAKLAVLQTEIFDMGEFGDAETVPIKTSPIDGYAYAYSEMTFLFAWRITAKKSNGITSGAAGETITRLRASINSSTGVVDTQVDYRLPRNNFGGTNTSDGVIQVVAICVRSGLTVTGTVAFDDLDDKAFFSGVILGDDDVIKINQNSKFSALRPEIFVTVETDGDTVPLPVSTIDGYTYVRAECFYIWVRNDTGAPIVGGSFLTLHGFIRQDTGVVKNKLLFHQQGGSGSIQAHGGFRCIIIAMRTKNVEVDADGGAAGGGGEGFEGEIEGDNVNPPANRTWLNNAYADVSDRPNRLRRTADDLLVVDIFKKAEGSLNDVLDSAAFQRLRLANLLVGDLPFNGDFEQFADGQDIADGWTKDFEIAGSPTYTRSASAFRGTYAQQINGGGPVNGGSVASRPFGVRAGFRYKFQCRAKIDDASSAQDGFYFRVFWYSNDDNLSRFSSSLISFDQIVIGTDNFFTVNNTYKVAIAELLAPATARFCRIAFYGWQQAGAARIYTIDTVTVHVGTVSLADAGIEGKTAANIAETGARKWLPELARIFTSSGKRANVEGLENAGNFKAGKFVGANPGIAETTQEISGVVINPVTSGWKQLGTKGIDIALEISSVTFDLTVLQEEQLITGKAFLEATNNVGFSISSGAASTPDASRTGNGPVTLNSPTTGTGLILGFWVRVQFAGASERKVSGTLSADKAMPISAVAIT